MALLFRCHLGKIWVIEWRLDFYRPEAVQLFGLGGK